MLITAVMRCRRRSTGRDSRFAAASKALFQLIVRHPSPSDEATGRGVMGYRPGVIGEDWSTVPYQESRIPHNTPYPGWNPSSVRLSRRNKAGRGAVSPPPGCFAPMRHQKETPCST